MAWHESSFRTYTGIWAVHLMWNGERRINVHSTHITQDDANKEARKYFNKFDRYLQLLDTVEVRDLPDQQFLALLSEGSTSLQISVVEQIPFSMNKEDLKIALRLKGIVKPSGGKPGLMRQLRQLIQKKQVQLLESRKTNEPLEEKKAENEISNHLVGLELNYDKENVSLNESSSEKNASNVFVGQKVLEEKCTNNYTV